MDAEDGDEFFDASEDIGTVDTIEAPDVIGSSLADSQKNIVQRLSGWIWALALQLGVLSMLCGLIDDGRRFCEDRWTRFLCIVNLVEGVCTSLLLVYEVDWTFLGGSESVPALIVYAGSEIGLTLAIGLAAIGFSFLRRGIWLHSYAFFITVEGILNVYFGYYASLFPAKFADQPSSTSFTHYPVASKCKAAQVLLNLIGFQGQCSNQPSFRFLAMPNGGQSHWKKIQIKNWWSIWCSHFSDLASSCSRIIWLLHYRQAKAS